MKKGFTLLELLVVIVIIILLISMIMPAMNLFKEAAKRTKARDSVQQLVTAWQTYLLNNREFPDVDITEMTPIAVSNLTGFMEFTTNEVAKGFLDPWGTKVYQVRLDNGRGGDGKAYDGKVVLPGGVILQKSVAAWSKGKDGKDDLMSAPPKDDVRSW